MESVVSWGRVVLRPASRDLAHRIVGCCPDDADAWAVGFPCDADIMSATLFLLMSHLDGEQHPFGLYVIERRADARVVGSINFKGRPCDGSVEIGYALAPCARGVGLGADAVRAALDLARTHGVQRVVARVNDGNGASRRTLTNAGLTLVGCDAGECRYEIVLHPPSG